MTTESQRFLCRLGVVAMVLSFGLTACSDEGEVSNPVESEQVAVLGHLDPGSCEGCTVQFTMLGVLGRASDSIGLRHDSRVTELSEGRFLVAPTTETGIALAFDSLGDVGRAVGRVGEGPGENAGLVGAFPWTQDTALLFQHFRIGFMSVNTGEQRTATYTGLNNPYDVVGLPAAGVVVVSPNRPPYPRFVLLDTEGVLAAQFGPRPTTERGADIHQQLSLLSAAPGELGFWASPKWYRGDFELWSTTGELLRVHRPERSWFEPYDSAALYPALYGGDQAFPPLPRLEALRATADGQLLASYMIAAAGWQKAADPVPEGTVPPFTPTSYDGALEVRDGTTGALLISVRLTQPIGGFVNDSVVFTKAEREDGFWEYTLYRMTIRGR